MTSRIVDSMNDAAPWTALAPDGVSASTQVTMVADPHTAGWGPDGVSARITAGAGAGGHRLQRTFAPVNLSEFTELRLSIKTHSAPGGGLVLEVRFASAAVAFDDPANGWHRLIPTQARRGWTGVRMSLDDLPAAVANAVTGIRLRCLAAPFVVHVDDVIVVRPRPLADADAALLAALDGIKLGAQPVVAAIRTPAQPLPAAPAVDIEQFDIRYAPGRVIDAPVFRDHTVDGHRDGVAGTPFDLDYAIRPVAADRATQAELLEAVLDRVPAAGELVIDGDRAPIELLGLAGSDRIGGAVGEPPVLVYRVGVRAPAVVGARVPRVEHVEVGGDLLEASFLNVS
jgi:hypothetical protein